MIVRNIGIVRSCISRFEIQYSHSLQQCTRSSFSTTTIDDSPVEMEYLQFNPASATKPEKSAPMVVLHGLLGSKQNNRTVCKRFAKDLNTTVYALDMRNHGDSPHRRVHDYPHLAKDVIFFLEKHLKDQPAVVLGHSMGAKTAMAVALTRPDLVSAMIAVDNAPVSAALGKDIVSYVDALHIVETKKLKSVRDAFKALEKYEKNADIRNFLLTNAIRTEDGSVAFRVPLVTLARSLSHIAEFPYDPHKLRYEGPSLFVRGTRSHYVPDESIPLIGQFFPRFILKDIDSGHWVISEKTNEFVRVVEEFLIKDD
ncbi:Alpha/Beta hydrolase protein [Lipomyces oligophaga]|uniref:Alpha/Beta hydrolase protein n=1 Tax=Lipomyces oligophaga TaxID=45792 RepID=UPI0034CEF403